MYITLYNFVIVKVYQTLKVTIESIVLIVILIHLRQNEFVCTLLILTICEIEI